MIELPGFFALFIVAIFELLLRLNGLAGPTPESLLKIRKMKKVYLKMLERFKELPSIKQLEEDYGQLEQSDKTALLKFPFVAFSISEPVRKNLTATKQVCDCEISLRLALDYGKDISISPYDIQEALEAKFQGWGDQEMNRWECKSLVKEPRLDGLVVFRFLFKTGYQKSPQ
ncbi:hypothetical protein ABIB30_005198 [Pedobacter sp. UYP1]